VSFGVVAAVATGDRAPRFESSRTDYGALIGARRVEPDGRWHWRVTQYCLPFWTMPPRAQGEKVVQSHIWVPRDDTHVVNWMVTVAHRAAPAPRGDPAARRGQGRARL
jgi:hypothetical protein